MAIQEYSKLSPTEKRESLSRSLDAAHAIACKDEQDHGYYDHAFEQRYGPCSELTADAIYGFATCVLQQPDVMAVYSLLATESPLPEKSWYDVILGVQHTPVVSMLSRHFKDFFIKKVNNVLDVATGPGTLLPALQEVGRHITAIDLNPAMVRLATKKLDTLHQANNIEGYETRVANAIDLDTIFPEESFSVITANGLVPYLSTKQRDMHFHAAHRVLKDGGLYYMPYLVEIPGKSNRHLFYDDGPKGKLLTLTSSTVLSFSARSEQQISTEVPDLSLYDFTFFDDVVYENPLMRIHIWQKV